MDGGVVMHVVSRDWTLICTVATLLSVQEVASYLRLIIPYFLISLISGKIK